MDRNESPDLGMEISLAEGYKVAFNLALVHDQAVPDQLWDLVGVLGRDGRSWVSRLIAMQAAALGVVSDPARGDQWRRTFRAISRSRQEHPLSRRYAGVLAGLLDRPATEQLRDVYRVVWVIDTESLATAGGDLDDEPAAILAAVTIVLNLVGARIKKAGAQLRSNEFRVPALTYARLPGCLDSAMLARASTRQPCSCGMKLCGPDLDQEVRRPVSPTFAYRCLSRTHEHSVFPSAAQRWQHALDIHLRRFATNQANPTD